MSTETSSLDQPLVIDGISYIPSSSLLTGITKLSFKDNHAFGVLDRRGECPRIYTSELGLYYNDTRYLSVWETTINGQTPVPLAHELRNSGNTLVFSMTNRDLPILAGAPANSGESRIRRDTLLIRRILTLHEDSLFEVLAIRNFDSIPHLLQLEHWAGGNFDDVFEVRGMHREKRGRLLPPQEDSRDGISTLTLAYEGLDGRKRSAHIQRLFKSEKIRIAPHLVGYFSRMEIPPKETLLIKTLVSFDEKRPAIFHGKDFRELSVNEMMSLAPQSQQNGLFGELSIRSDNALVNRAIENAETDIRMLLTQEDASTYYPYAGVPWFSAPFGRDGLITAYQLLPWYPKIARGVLDYVFKSLGKSSEAFTDEQPGKVFHEFRRGEMAATREIPFIPYYGSVDSTPLALVLLHEYISWTRDFESLGRWWPAALQALEWMDLWGDIDRDGFLEYAKQSPTGLVNQGWKDSHNSVMHADGRLAHAPIRLCEVQAYAFRAKQGMSQLARLRGDEVRAQRLRTEALQLRNLFNDRFWNSAKGAVHLALDGDSKPCDVLSSNMGHCLWGKILSPEQAQSVSAHLMSESLFSGHGIRTLADTEEAFNPMSYHNGSIWPHDNSLILEGMRYYEQGAHLTQLALALLGVLESSDDFRLPELYCGFRKRGTEPPIPYEVACKPQAWAAGSVFLMLKSLLGISRDLDQNHIVFHSPILPPQINTVDITGLKGSDWELDLSLRRSRHGTSVEVIRRSGSVRVLTVK